MFEKKYINSYLALFFAYVSIVQSKNVEHWASAISVCVGVSAVACDPSATKFDKFVFVAGV